MTRTFDIGPRWHSTASKEPQTHGQQALPGFTSGFKTLAHTLRCAERAGAEPFQLASRQGWVFSKVALAWDKEEVPYTPNCDDCQQRIAIALHNN